MSKDRVSKILRLSAIQRLATHEIFIGLRRQRAALLQLPTGFGKSLIAVSIFERLRKKNPKLRLVVVIPKQNIPDGWRKALGFSNDIDMFTWIEAPIGHAQVRFETHHSLTRALFIGLGGGKGRPPALATELHSRKHLIVVDEIHRYRKFVNIMSSIFLNSSDQNVDESALTKPFRTPYSGPCRQWPKWLMLSATPYNPVSLDLVEEGQDFESQDELDEKALANEVQVILGTLAYLSGLDNEEWFEEHIKKARDYLSDSQKAKPLQPPAQLIIWPGLALKKALRPPEKLRWNLGRVKTDKNRIEMAFKEIILTAKALHKSVKEDMYQRSMAERFVLAGGFDFFNVKGNIINDYEYSRNLAISVKNVTTACRNHNRLKKPIKLEALVNFVKKLAKNQHILIFCVHRAVASAVAKVLKTEIEEELVRTAIGGIKDKDDEWFNGLIWDNDLLITENKKYIKPRVLVCTDACSESIDLHLKSNVLVHYELPWSPLRALQRVGRLWRIRPNEISNSKKTQPTIPGLPGIVHFAHPGSVDEEILSRLYRRWGHLEVLGLDYLSYEEALGTRLPAVDWVMDKK